ncbi:response regulator [Ideonella sp. BN130291]|uniref:response regulator n=1 Tax=Ideonella sp. BN130291 TaxID=3112940 RepID=UPI002E255889|nr:response regulator [Ideonella sp. BN130291]
MTNSSWTAGPVLVVDDNEDAADGLAALLRGELGCAVYTAYDGAEALDKAGEVHPEVVVMDITMPHVDGIEAAGLLRRVFRHKAPRLIAVSGRCSEADAEEAQAWGFDHLLAKPVDVARLVDAVRGTPEHHRRTPR